MSSIAAPTRFLSAGIKSSRSMWASVMILSIGSAKMSAWYRVRRVGSFGKPRALVAFPCGSQSISRVLFSEVASEAPRLTAVVVLPTPPFWLAMAMTRANIISSGPRRKSSKYAMGLQHVSRETLHLEEYSLLHVEQQ